MMSGLTLLYVAVAEFAKKLFYANAENSRFLGIGKP